MAAYELGEFPQPIRSSRNGLYLPGHVIIDWFLANYLLERTISRSETNCTIT